MQKVKVEKIIGYLLLALGLGTIVYSVFNVVGVFTGKNQPYQLFSFSSIGFDFSGLMAGQPIAQSAETELKQDLFESDLINKPANITAHVVLMGFIASAGLKIGQIGTMLIRTIKVKLREERNPAPKT